MKHQEFNGYPTEFCFVCREGATEVNRRVNVYDRKHFNEIDRFYKELEEHGYDIFKPGDDFRYKEALYIINEASKRYATKNGYSSYEELVDFEEVCRCGKWVFLRRYPYNFEMKEIEIKKGRGGKREGSGRKSQCSKALGRHTAVIRVPQFEKDKIKDLIDWLIAKREEGVFLHDAIYSGAYSLERLADDQDTYDKDRADHTRAEAALLKELYSKLPSFTLKEEYDKTYKEELQKKIDKTTNL